jgi:hypothetical protein
MYIAWGKKIGDTKLYVTRSFKKTNFFHNFTETVHNIEISERHRYYKGSSG